jgi:hypothetical protein
MSYVATLTTDAEEVRNPTREDVERAIDTLDSTHVTLVVLAPRSPDGSPEGEHHMAIGGGKDDRCVVYITKDNLGFWNLEDPSKASSMTRVMMVAGGQDGDYREAQCVPKQWAKRAASVYFEHGIPAPDLPWKRD